MRGGIGGGEADMEGGRKGEERHAGKEGGIYTCFSFILAILTSNEVLL